MRVQRTLIVVDPFFDKKSDIILADTVKLANRAKIVAVGEDVTKVKVGEVITHQPHAGYAFFYKEEGKEDLKTLIMSESDVWAID